MTVLTLCLPAWAQRRVKKYWKKRSGMKYLRKDWNDEVVALARKGERKWTTDDDAVTMPDEFNDDLFIEKNVRKDPTGKYRGKTIYKGPTRGAYLFLNGRVVTPWDTTDEDDSVLDPANWDDDTVTEKKLLAAREYYLWKKLFLGVPDKVSQNPRTPREDYNVFEMSLGRFNQVPALDMDSSLKRRPARCSGCNRKSGPGQSRRGINALFT